jgi:DNA-binding beta-propeller fold protein YncE
MNRDLHWARSPVRAPVRTAAILIVAAAALLFAAPAGASVRRAGLRQAGGGVERSLASEGSRIASLSRGEVFRTRFGSGSALGGSAQVGNGPGADALDEATDTLYVANGENDNGPNATGNTVSVIDTRRCDAQDVSHYKGPWPTITVGNLPSGIAIDERTDTVYVANLGDNTLSVLCPAAPATCPAP